MLLSWIPIFYLLFETLRITPIPWKLQIFSCKFLTPENENHEIFSFLKIEIKFIIHHDF